MIKIYVLTAGGGVVSAMQPAITKFSAGELSVYLPDKKVSPDHNLLIEFGFTGSDSIIELLLTVDALRRTYKFNRMYLSIKYFPAARDDRQMVLGASFGLKVYADLIKSCNFDAITVIDPHSDVLGGMFEPGVLNIIPQYDLWSLMHIEVDAGDGELVIVSPDAGAFKKASKVAAHNHAPMISCRKVRDPSTGKILETVVEHQDGLDGKIFVIVDDICDGGGTFIPIAEEIRKMYDPKKVCLAVTHGIMSAGLDRLKCFDQIIVINNMMEDQEALLRFNKGDD